MFAERSVNLEDLTNGSSSISYSHSAQSRAGRVVIKLLENATGRIRLIKRAQNYDQEISAEKCFWHVMLERYGLSLDIKSGALTNIPRNGPIVLIANHPYGILDGLIMGYILARRCCDFRILANHVFHEAKELKNVIIPISFDESKEAVQHNLQSRKWALNYLKAGGAIGVFPGGTVSTSLTPFSRPMDPSWRSFTARMITKSNATVVPIYFEGHTSRLFQIASHVHYTLRMGLLINEFRQRVDGPVSISIGNPIDPTEISQRSNDVRILMQFLRQKTYDLAEHPIDPFAHGFEFEQRYKIV
tara:strand:- start:134 stop:1039 length:906 start_codon:yes stop_codon:yes gene_type:complete